VTVYILPDALKGEVRDEMQDNPARFITIDDFRPKYLEYFKVLRTALATALKEPHSLIPGSPLTGGAMADFMPRFADAINSQAALNVPSLFQASRNDAVNRALTKLKSDFTVNVDKSSSQAAIPTVDFSRTIDKQITLLLTDVEISLSYMPPEVIRKLRVDAAEILKPVKENALAVNLLKLRSMALSMLKTVEGSLEATMRTQFPPEKLTVTKLDLDSSWSSLQSLAIGKYEADVSSLDPSCAPEGWRAELTKALEAQKAVLDAGYASFWARYLDSASSKALDTLRAALDDLVAKTAAGDSSAWEAGQLTAMDTAKSSFKSVLSREYLGTESMTAQKNFDAEVESTAKTRQALWAKHDSEVLDELNRKLKKQQFVYSTRLADSLLPERQPPAYDAIVNAQVERVSTAWLLAFVRLLADERCPECPRKLHHPQQGRITNWSRYA
jgi:hypothetical protein